jgi:hypothetical protein
MLFGHVSVPGIPANVALLLLRIYAGYTIMMAGLDKLPLPAWMTEQVAAVGFPVSGLAEEGSVKDVRNIGAYVPRSGWYRFDFNLETLAYSLDTLSTN